METGTSVEALQQALQSSLFATWVAEMGLTVRAVEPGCVTLALPVAPKLVHGGGVLCGQAMMAAADTAMVLAVMSQLGSFKPMTTVQLQTSFLRPVPATDTEVAIVGRVLRLGKSLVFGEIALQDAQGRLAAQATTTYALL